MNARTQWLSLGLLYFAIFALILYIIQLLISLHVALTDNIVNSIFTIIAALLGSFSAYVLLTYNEKRKEAGFEQRVKDAIHYELNKYYDVLKEALETGKPRTDRANTLALDRESDVARKHVNLNLQNPIYNQLNFDTKIKTLDSSLIDRLDRIYREIAPYSLHMYFQDTGTEVYYAVSKKEAENLKNVIGDAIQSL